MVRAKFHVVEIDKLCNSYDSNEVVHRIILNPVSHGSAENKQFWEATPSGHIEMTVRNSAVKDFFVLGESYYVDFNQAK